MFLALLLVYLQGVGLYIKYSCQIILKSYFLSTFVKIVRFKKALKSTSLEHHREKTSPVPPIFYCIFWCPSSHLLDLKWFLITGYMLSSVRYPLNRYHKVSVYNLLRKLTKCMFQFSKSCNSIHHYVFSVNVPFKIVIKGNFAKRLVVSDKILLFIKTGL